MAGSNGDASGSGPPDRALTAEEMAYWLTSDDEVAKAWRAAADPVDWARMLISFRKMEGKGARGCEASDRRKEN